MAKIPTATDSWTMVLVEQEKAVSVMLVVVHVCARYRVFVEPERKVGRVTPASLRMGHL